MDEPKQWVEGPYSLIPASRSGAVAGKKTEPEKVPASEMTCLHNSIIRGINAVYRQCVNVAERGSSKDKLDFASFAYVLAEMIHEHHNAEEEHIFPGINEITGIPGLMDGSVQEHKIFHPGLQEYTEYTAKVKDAKEALDGERLKTIIDSFMPALHTHLNNEIDSLVKLEDFKDKIDWPRWWKEAWEVALKPVMASYEARITVIPLAFVLHDKTYADNVFKNFPPMPWLAYVVLRFMYMSKNSNHWRFAPCNLSCQPKELPFV